ncbi:MAG: hypothetical protein EOP04_03650 [Proteobacteria bacterium]|nr:MAG: hypothetical protein EOP04_03650 [Pseudomonadota bacterium]
MSKNRSIRQIIVNTVDDQEEISFRFNAEHHVYKASILSIEWDGLNPSSIEYLLLDTRLHEAKEGVIEVLLDGRDVFFLSVTGAIASEFRRISINEAQILNNE